MFPSIARVSLVLATLSWFSMPTLASEDECQPVTWAAKRDILDRDLTSTNNGASSTGKVTTTGTTPAGPGWTLSPGRSNSGKIAAGQVNCRFWDHTGDKVNYYTCAEFANRNDITVEKFFLLNPDVKSDCSNVKTNMEYCAIGYIQPVVSNDGFCGPKYGNSTCKLTNSPCCNSQTWKCGNTVADCAEGTCWEGACDGHTVYSMDGKCGYANNNLLCAGKWGNCCNMKGQCGTGAAFCGDGNCQSGNCTTPINRFFPDLQRVKVPGNSTDGTCGGSKAFTCSVLFGECCNKNNLCGSDPEDCAPSNGCQSKFGKCDGIASTSGASSAKTTSITTASSKPSSTVSASATTKKA